MAKASPLASTLNATASTALAAKKLASTSQAKTFYSLLTERAKHAAANGDFSTWINRDRETRLNTYVIQVIQDLAAADGLKIGVTDQVIIIDWSS